jgi:hypothetical protein
MALQRVAGIALGYEDLNDHDELRHDPVLALPAGKLAAKRAGCAPLAGKSPPDSNVGFLPLAVADRPSWDQGSPKLEVWKPGSGYYLQLSGVPERV